MSLRSTHSSVRRAGALCGLLILASGPARAVEVYRWVDAGGVVHFSQTAPAAAGVDYRREVVDGAAPAGYDPDQDIYDVAGQQERMRARREALAQDLEARRQREAERAPVTAAPPVQGYPVHGWPGYGQRPPYRPRPPIEPPIEPSPPAATLKPPPWRRD